MIIRRWHRNAQLLDKVQTTVLEAYETTLVSNNVVSGDAVAVTTLRLRLLRRSLRDQSSSEESEENRLSKSKLHTAGRAARTKPSLLK